VKADGYRDVMAVCWGSSEEKGLKPHS